MTDLLQMLYQYICQHSEHAHWIICGLILLAGLNVPISEDFLLLCAGAMASTQALEAISYTYGLVFLACLIAGWETYWMGRLLGQQLLRWPWFKRVLNPQRVKSIDYFFNRFGMLTFVVGRFIPGGVRNALFLSSGLIKMPFKLFMLRDFFGCLLASSVVFYVGYLFGSHASVIFGYMHVYERSVALVFVGCLALIFMRRSRRFAKRSVRCENI